MYLSDYRPYKKKDFKSSAIASVDFDNEVYPATKDFYVYLPKQKNQIVDKIYQQLSEKVQSSHQKRLHIPKLKKTNDEMQNLAQTQNHFNLQDNTQNKLFDQTEQQRNHNQHNYGNPHHHHLHEFADYQKNVQKSNFKQKLHSHIDNAQQIHAQEGLTEQDIKNLVKYGQQTTTQLTPQRQKSPQQTDTNNFTQKPRKIYVKKSNFGQTFFEDSYRSNSPTKYHPLNFLVTPKNNKLQLKYNKVQNDIFACEDLIAENKELIQNIKQLNNQKLLKQYEQNIVKGYGKHRINYVYNDYHLKATNPGYGRNQLGGFYTK